MNKKQLRTRSKLRKNTERPRLSVFRSNKYICAQIIDDVKNKTLVFISEEKQNEKLTKTERAKKTGEALAKKAIAKKIKKVTFDRGSFAYHGRIMAFAEGAREGGLEF